MIVLFIWATQGGSQNTVVRLSLRKPPVTHAGARCQNRSTAGRTPPPSLCLRATLLSPGSSTKQQNAGTCHPAGEGAFCHVSTLFSGSVTDDRGFFFGGDWQEDKRWGLSLRLAVSLSPGPKERARHSMILPLLPSGELLPRLWPFRQK